MPRRKTYSASKFPENPETAVKSEAKVNNESTVAKEYNIGDTVICYHNSHPYKAKCTNVRTGDNGVEYLIHYVGWSKKWDNWVTSDLILEYNEDNEMEVSKNIHLSRSNRKSKRSLSASPASENDRSNLSSSVIATDSPDGLRGRKRKDADLPVKKTEQPKPTPIFPGVTVPKKLINFLENHCRQIVYEKRKDKYPAELTVENITEMYMQTCKEIDDERFQILYEEFAEGIYSVFNQVCVDKLLLEDEREEYNELVKSNPNALPSCVFGLVHLCRLFVRLNDVFSVMDCPSACLPSLQHYVTCYASFLCANFIP